MQVDIADSLLTGRDRNGKVTGRAQYTIAKLHIHITAGSLIGIAAEPCRAVAGSSGKLKLSIIHMNLLNHQSLGTGGCTALQIEISS